MPKIPLKFLRTLAIVYFSVLIYSCGSPKEATTEKGYYKSPTYVKKKYNRILVIAKLEQEVYRKRVEYAMVKELKDWGFTAVAAVDYFVAGTQADSVKVLAKLDSLQIDAALVLKNAAGQTYVDERAFYTGSMYSVFGGFYYASFDTDTRAGKIIYMKTDFVTRDPRQLQWSRVAPINLTQGIELSVQELSVQTRRHLTSDKIL